jgi:hypothetical protein
VGGVAGGHRWEGWEGHRWEGSDGDTAGGRDGRYTQGAARRDRYVSKGHGHPLVRHMHNRNCMVDLIEVVTWPHTTPCVTQLTWRVPLGQDQTSRC